jgi:hypothetical protein
VISQWRGAVEPASLSGSGPPVVDVLDAGFGCEYGLDCSIEQLVDVRLASWLCVFPHKGGAANGVADVATLIEALSTAYQTTAAAAGTTSIVWHYTPNNALLRVYRTAEPLSGTYFTFPTFTFPGRVSFFDTVASQTDAQQVIDLTHGGQLSSGTTAQLAVALTFNPTATAAATCVVEIAAGGASALRIQPSVCSLCLPVPATPASSKT